MPLLLLLQVDLSADPSSCICPHCSVNDGSPCLLEAARRNLAAQKPQPPSASSSVDRLQLSQLGVTRRLLNPQLYELHDDVSEWTTADDRMATEDAAAAAASVDGPTPETADSVPELNGQSASDQEEVWSDCTAELPPDDDRKAQIGRSSAAEISSGCPAAKTGGGDGSGGSAGATTVESVEMDAECPVAAEEAVEPGSAASELPEPRTTCRATAATCCAAAATCCVAAATCCAGETTSVTAAKTSCAGTARPPTATTTRASRTTSTAAAAAAACVAATTTTSGKSDRPRASPCRAPHAKLTPPPPVANGRDAKPPAPCKAAAAAAAATGKQSQSSSLSSAAAAKLLADMVGRSKSSASPAASAQCKLTQCVDKIHDAATAAGAAADNGSCSGEKTSSRISAAAGNNTADGRKDAGGKFCECWHCEFFGHMSVSTHTSCSYVTLRSLL